MWAWSKSIWKMHMLLSKRQLLWLKSLERVKREHEKVCHEANMLHKTQNPCENMFCFKCNFIPRNLRIHECYQYLLHLTKFISIDYSSQQTYMDNIFFSNWNPKFNCSLVLNYCKRFWLLYDASFTILVIITIMGKEYAHQVAPIPSLQFDEFALR